MRRILVIGCSGAGKSTFSKKLSQSTGLPLVSLDKEFWRPGWTMPPRTQWRQRVAELCQAERWIMDGTFDSSLDLRLPLADTVLWFKLPRRICLARVAKRVAFTYGRVRSEMAPGCPERVDLEFLRYVWTFEKRQEPSIARALMDHGSHITPVIFRRDAEAQRFLDSSVRITLRS